MNRLGPFGVHLPILGSFLLAGFCLSCETSLEIPTPTDRETVQSSRKGQSQILPLKIKPFSYAVAGENNLIFLGRGQELVVIKVEDQGQSVVLARTPLAGEVRDIDVKGDYVFVAVRGSGLSIVDCTVPNRPKQVGLFVLPLAEGVDVFHDKAYVAAQTSGIRIVDVSVPGHPRAVGSYQTSEAALKLKVQGTFLYVAASYAGTRILDVMDPSQISEVGFATRGSYGQGSAWDVAVSGNRAYSAIPDNGLRQVDIEEPAKAETLSIYRGLYAPVAVVVSESHAFVADQSAGLRIITLGKDEMKEVGRLSFDDSVMDVVLVGKRLLLALKTRGLSVLNVDDPTRPRQEASLVLIE